jgi:ketosteroid isomerase-like protein
VDDCKRVDEPPDIFSQKQGPCAWNLVGFPVFWNWWIVEEEMSLKDPKQIVLLFNMHINNRDIDSLAAMMTEDHTFIDSSDEVHAGKEMMVAGWKDFFEAYPDYRNHFEEVESRGDLVLVIGHSTCSFEALDGPALWTAKVAGELVQEWRVYLDTAENREMLELPPKGR